MSSLCRRGFVLMAIASLAFWAPVSRGAYVVSVQQVGADVVATGNGSLDTADLTLFGSDADVAFIDGNAGAVAVGETGFAFGVNEYSGISGPTSFGSGSSVLPNSGTGPLVGIFGNAGDLATPTGYVSGSVFDTSSDTWSNQTFVSLGVTPGTYEWTWGSGVDADSFTVQIGPAVSSVPLPVGIWGALLAVPLVVVARKRMRATLVTKVTRPLFVSAHRSNIL